MLYLLHLMRNPERAFQKDSRSFKFSSLLSAVAELKKKLGFSIWQSPLKKMLSDFKS